MTTLITWGTTLRQRIPPWLQRFVGGGLMDSLAEQFDTLQLRTVESMKMRFPAGGVADSAAIALTGSERRIARGPGEDFDTYAGRIEGWWDAHRTRGGPYAMLNQLFAYFRFSLNVPIDLVYHSGRRYQMDVDGNIVRDDITWSADGSSEWAQIWIVFHLGVVPIAGGNLVTQAGDQLITQAGDALITQNVFTAESLTGLSDEVFTVIVREWLAAHIKRATIVLLHNDARLWGYPFPLGTWDSPEPPSRITWGGTGPPVFLVVEQ